MKKYVLSDEKLENAVRKMIKRGQTVRQAAKEAGISKSGFYSNIMRRLEHIDKVLYNQAVQLLQYNKSVRYYRGGEATKRKYLKESFKSIKRGKVAF